MTLFEVWQPAPGNEAALLAILDHIPTPIVCCELGDAVRTLYINRQFERLFGYTLADIPSVGEWARRAYPDEAYRCSLILPWQAALRQSVHDGSPIAPLEARSRCKDGQVRDIVIHTAVVGRMLLMSLTDITERKRTESRYRLLTESMRDVVWVLDAETLRFVYVSPAVQAVRGYTPEEAMRQSLEEIHAPASQAVARSYFRQLLQDLAAGRRPQNFRGELEYRCRDGSTYWTEVFVYPVLDAEDRLQEIVGVSRDIAEHKRYALALQQAKEAADRANQALQAANAELQRIATTDALTGAWNRRQFQHLLEVEMASAARRGSALSLLMFDVDHFKRVNDRHGHQVGDQVLVRISELTQRQLRTEDALARWGGEEFVVLLPHSTAAEATRLAERLRSLLADCTMPAVGRISASYGVAQWQPGEMPDSWFRRLDQALYRAKAAGRNRVELA